MSSRQRRSHAAPLVVVMGVAGCGKSTIGDELARRLGVAFVDGDDLHPPANVAKMQSGIPLTGADRLPWLEKVGRTLRHREPTGLVVACSALRLQYRDIIRRETPNTYFIHLEVPRDVLAQRIVMRPQHYMPISLLDSQMQLLEPLRPHENGIAIDGTLSIDRIIATTSAAVRTREPFSVVSHAT